MKRWSRWTTWISLLLVIVLASACGNASNFVQGQYPLVDVAGKGKASAQVYEAENKTVPAVAKELAEREKPKEISKEDPDQMFLVYDNRIINLQKHPDNPEHTLIEINSLEYAKQHYSSSFLEGYIAASIIQSMFGGGWYDSGKNAPASTSYKGYSGQPSRSETSGMSTESADKKPTTTDKTGSFTTKGSAAQTPSTPPPSGSTPSSGSSSKQSAGNWSTTSKSGSSSIRKNDGSTPSVKSYTAPKTTKKTGSFSVKKSRRR